jgi:ThiJ/PfpI family-like
VTQKLLVSLPLDRSLSRSLTVHTHIQGATSKAVKAYDTMAATPEFQTPLSWSSPTFSLTPYNLIFLPGGHEKGVRQLIDSPIMAQHLASYFPQTIKPSNKNVAAVCHGVLALAVAKLSEGENKGKSILHECVTTALPGTFEGVAFWGTRLFLGDYYKTYGVGSDSVETAVSASVGCCDVVDAGCRSEKCWIILISSTRTALDRVRKSLIVPAPTTTASLTDFLLDLLLRTRSTTTLVRDFLETQIC